MRVPLNRAQGVATAEGRQVSVEETVYEDMVVRVPLATWDDTVCSRYQLVPGGGYSVRLSARRRSSAERIADRICGAIVALVIALIVFGVLPAFFDGRVASVLGGR